TRFFRRRQVQAHGQNGDEDMLGKQESDNARDRPDGEEPPRDEDRHASKNDLPEAEMNTLERTLIADSGRRQRRNRGSHDPIVTENGVPLQTKMLSYENLSEGLVVPADHRTSMEARI